MTTDPTDLTPPADAPLPLAVYVDPHSGPVVQDAHGLTLASVGAEGRGSLDADLDVARYLVACANAAPGLVAEVAEWAAVGSHALDLFDPMCKGRAPHPSDVRYVLGAVKAANASLRAERDEARDEVERLRGIVEAMNPEHNYMALLDLYDERERQAQAERDTARAALARIERVLEQGPRYTDRHMESAADAVVEEVREAMEASRG